MKAFSVFLVLSIFVIYSCESTTETDVQVETKIATLIWDNPSVDGCGFFLEFDEKRYKPINEEIIYNNLDTPYAVAVEIEFKDLNKEIEYVCGFSGTQKENAIELISIKPKIIRCGTVFTIIKTDKAEYAADSTTIINVEVINPFSSPFYYICSGDIFLEELQNNKVSNSWKVHGFKECLAANKIDSFDKRNFSISLFTESTNIDDAFLDNNYDYRLKFLLYQNKDFTQLLAGDLLFSEKFKLLK